MAYIKGGKPRYETSGIWIRRELVNKQKEEQAEAKKADIDSVDSVICAWSTPMLRPSSRAPAVFSCERKGSRRLKTTISNARWRRFKMIPAE
jgi:hypothetical protein